MTSDSVNDERPRESLGSSWQGRLDKVLDPLIESKTLTRSQFIDILWDYGILGRIAPTDSIELQARINANKTVWTGTRDDPQLYWRILYSTASVLDAIQGQFSISVSSSSYIAGSFSGIYKLLFEPELFSKLYPTFVNQADSQVDIMNDLSARAKHELLTRGVDTAQHPIRHGMQGTWEGMQVTVDSFSGDGGIYFQTENYEERVKLGDLTKGHIGIVLPWDIDSTQFHSVENPPVSV